MTLRAIRHASGIIENKLKRSEAAVKGDKGFFCVA